MVVIVHYTRGNIALFGRDSFIVIGLRLVVFLHVDGEIRTRQIDPGSNRNEVCNSDQGVFNGITTKLYLMLR